jgi:O-6-methylguanine DNA methyltransferase
VIDAIARLLSGQAVDLSRVRLDMEGLPALCQRFYAATRRIAAGETMTYGQVAVLAGMPGAARVVGNALSRNPFPIIVPCHRVVAAGRRLGGFSPPSAGRSNGQAREAVIERCGRASGCPSLRSRHRARENGTSTYCKPTVKN